ncbi:hypothetical protein [Maribellus maritimus]|uniref:hypothetical protein n=1 Tax=Maribellus maritimus TaxID=2870838 RepID=UPI001EEB26E0|nr:hypothetical protein [Maribellus maritimus]MCG6189130.1 hypothetical protein [Maribellus maritimus]
MVLRQATILFRGRRKAIASLFKINTYFKHAATQTNLSFLVTPSTRILYLALSSQIKKERSALLFTKILLGFQYKVVRKTGASESIFSGAHYGE